MKHLIVFDLDGTLAESKSPLDAEMSALQSRGQAFSTDASGTEVAVARDGLSFAKTPQQLNLTHVTCYTTSLYVGHFKRALNSGEAQA